MVLGPPKSQCASTSAWTSLRGLWYMLSKCDPCSKNFSKTRHPDQRLYDFLGNFSPSFLLWTKTDRADSTTTIIRGEGKQLLWRSTWNLPFRLTSRSVQLLLLYCARNWKKSTAPEVMETCNSNKLWNYENQAMY